MRRPRKLPPPRTWVEEIDDKFVVGCATMTEIRIKRGWIEGRYAARRFLYGLSCFVLVERPRDRGWQHAAKAAAVTRLGDLAHLRGGQLALIGLADGIEDH